MPALVWMVICCAFGGAQLHRLGEAPLAAVQIAAVHVGVVEEVDAGVARRADQRADGLVIELRDPHQPEHDVRHTVRRSCREGRFFMVAP